MYRRCRPIVAPAQYRVHDRFVPRPQPVIHPVVHVDRVNVVNVPRHIYKPIRKQVVVDPWGCC